MYLNYNNIEVNDIDDNPPIRIILCADKDEIAAEYALGGLNNQIFASKYTLYIPAKEKLIREVELLLEKEKMRKNLLHNFLLKNKSNCY